MEPAFMHLAPDAHRDVARGFKPWTAGREPSVALGRTRAGTPAGVSATHRKQEPVLRLLFLLLGCRDGAESYKDSFLGGHGRPPRAMDGAEWDNHMDVGAEWTRPQLPKKLDTDRITTYKCCFLWDCPTNRAALQHTTK